MISSTHTAVATRETSEERMQHQHQHGVAHSPKKKKKFSNKGGITSLEERTRLKISSSKSRARPEGRFRYDGNGQQAEQVSADNGYKGDRSKTGNSKGTRHSSGTTELPPHLQGRDISLTSFSPTAKTLVASRPPRPRSHAPAPVATVPLEPPASTTNVNETGGEANDDDTYMNIVEAQEVKGVSFFQNRNRKKILSLFAVLVILMCALVTGLSVALMKKKTPSLSQKPEVTSVFSQVTDPLDGPTDSEYGSSVAICGDGSRVAISGPGKALVQVFQLSIGGGGREQVGEDLYLSNYDSNNASKFVRSELVVELSNDCNVLAIGEPYWSNETSPDNEGRVTLFEFVRGSWEPLGIPNTITGSNSQDYAGASVSLSHDGGIVAIGSPGFGTNNGQVQIYLLNGRTWNHLGGSINGEFDDQAFGVSVSLSSKDNIDVVAVGSSTGTGDNNATVHVYEFRTGDWKSRGSSIVIDEEVALDGQEMSWMVRLSWDGKRLVTSNLYLKNEITLHDNGLLVKAYEFDERTQTWTQLGKNLHQHYPGAKSGYIVSMSRDGTRMGMGDPGSELVGGLTGHAHFYELIDGEKWCQIGPDIDGDAAGDMAGFSVSLSGDGEWLVMGSPFSRAQGQTHGRVRIWYVDRQNVVPKCDV